MIDNVDIESRLTEIRSRITAACKRFDRDPDTVNLLAVSKTKPLGMILTAARAGQVHFGENYLQEAVDKISAVQPGITWHYIGAIQSNKTRPIAESFDWVHTVANEKVARRLGQQRPNHLPPLKVLIQVNIGGEASKAGVEASKLATLLRSIIGLPNIEIRGLMAIPSPETDFDRQCDSFRQLRELKLEMAALFGDQLPLFQDLSMGMTGDLDAAVKEGATWLRIGTAIFGERA